MAIHEYTPRQYTYRVLVEYRGRTTGTLGAGDAEITPFLDEIERRTRFFTQNVKMSLQRKAPDGTTATTACSARAQAVLQYSNWGTLNEDPQENIGERKRVPCLFRAVRIRSTVLR